MAATPNAVPRHPLLADIQTLPDCLARYALRSPDATSFTWTNNKGTKTRSLTFRELDDCVKQVGQQLLKFLSCGDRAILCYLLDDGLDFLIVFLGCCHVGVIPVAVVPVDPNRFDYSMGRLGHVIEDTDAKCVLTNSGWYKTIIQSKWAMYQATFQLKKKVAANPKIENWRKIPWHSPSTVFNPKLKATSTAPTMHGDTSTFCVKPTDIAFLQFTSGSTGDGKGVIVTHANLVAQFNLLVNSADIHMDGKDVIGAWLPLYHDMGLIGIALLSLFVGSPCHLMSPITFIQKPELFLQLVSKHKITLTAMPNFAFHVLSKTTNEKKVGLNFDHVRFICCGAEPIQETTMKKFSTTFADGGIREDMIHPAMGLAEMVLMATMRPSVPKNDKIKILSANEHSLHHNLKFVNTAKGEKGISIVECGVAPKGVTLVIVDEETLEELPAGSIGEIWFQSESVASGYWGKPALTTSTFRATICNKPERGPFLRTGDLGFLHDGVLYVTGRSKDVIIIGGANYFPQLIEAIAETSHPDIRLGCVAAFGTLVDDLGTEQLVITAEVKNGSRNHDACAQAIKTAVMANVGLACIVNLLKQKTIVKTSSGKVARRPTKLKFREGSLNVVWEDEKSPTPVPTASTHDPAPTPASDTVAVADNTNHVAIGRTQSESDTTLAPLGTGDQVGRYSSDISTDSMTMEREGVCALSATTLTVTESDTSTTTSTRDWHNIGRAASDVEPSHSQSNPPPSSSRVPTSSVAGMCSRNSSETDTVSASFTSPPPLSLSQPPLPPPPLPPPSSQTQSALDTQARLVTMVACKLNIAEHEVNIDTPFPVLGLTSIQLMGLTGELAHTFAIEIEPTAIYSHPEIRSMAIHVAEQCASTTNTNTNTNSNSNANANANVNPEPGGNVNMTIDQLASKPMEGVAAGFGSTTPTRPSYARRRRSSHDSSGRSSQDATWKNSPKAIRKQSFGVFPAWSSQVEVGMNQTSKYRAMGLFSLQIDDIKVDGRTVHLNGRPCVNFGLCSYSGLELRRELIDGASAAMERYGIQMALSRAYLSTPLYRELESLLHQMTDAHCVVAQSTTLIHLAVLPTFIREGDIVLIDGQAHNSIQTVAKILSRHGSKVSLVNHNNIKQVVAALIAHPNKAVWYLADGIYSMYGDYCPLEALKQLQSKHANLHLYIDDAHGFGWSGQFGRGYAMDVLGPLNDRTIVVASLSKAFAAGGGVAMLGTAAQKQKILQIGGPMVFGGPIQIPVLGALIGSCKLHLSDELNTIQDNLERRIDQCTQLLVEAGLPLVSRDPIPIRFIGCGTPDVAEDLVKRLVEDGFLVNMAAFPAVPMGKAGVRFTLTNHQTLDDITRLVQCITKHFDDVLLDHGWTMEQVFELFGIQGITIKSRRKHRPSLIVNNLTLHEHTSIHQIPADEWDALFGDLGSNEHNSLVLLEGSQLHTSPGDSWDFNYYICKDERNNVVCATYFTTCLWKDDMLAPNPSLDEARRNDPTFGTSRVMMTGSLLSLGNPLYVNEDLDWQHGLKLIISSARATMKKHKASMIVFQTTSTTCDVAKYLDSQGFGHRLLPRQYEVVVERTEDEWYNKLKRGYRRAIRNNIHPVRNKWSVTLYDYKQQHAQQQQQQQQQHVFEHLNKLYRNVHARASEISTFPIPTTFIQNIASTPGWELLVLHYNSEDTAADAVNPHSLDTAVSFLACNTAGDAYVPLFAGVDYSLLEQGAYRMLLFSAIERARELSLRTVKMGMSCEREKKRIGCTYTEPAMFFQMDDEEKLEGR